MPLSARWRPAAARPVAAGLFIGIAVGSNTVLTFDAVAAKTYSVLYKDALSDAGWSKLTDVPAPAVDQTETVVDTAAGSTRFYVLVTPATP